MGLEAKVYTVPRHPDPEPGQGRRGRRSPSHQECHVPAEASQHAGTRSRAVTLWVTLPVLLAA